MMFEELPQTILILQEKKYTFMSPLKREQHTLRKLAIIPTLSTSDKLLWVIGQARGQDGRQHVKKECGQNPAVSTKQGWSIRIYHMKKKTSFLAGSPQ